MKYPFRFVSVIMFTLSTLAFSRTVYLQENFSSPTFPPAGWSIYQYGSATWQRAVESGNGYARGSATMNSGTHLKTLNFSISGSGGVVLHIRFKNRNYNIGQPPSPMQWRVMLYNGSQEQYSWVLSSTGPNWTDRDLTLYQAFSDNHHIEWWLQASFSSSDCIAYYDIDDVEIVGCYIQDVAPSSVGNIKAIFR